METEQQPQDVEWVDFWFESNVVWGPVFSLEDWKGTLAEWHVQHLNLSQTDIYSLATSKCKLDLEFPSFGISRDHINGEMTLGEFFDKHGMEKVVSPVKVPIF